MPLTITNDTLSSPIDKSEIEQNFSDIEDWSIAITNSDVAAGAAIDIEKLASKYTEVHITFRYASGAGLPAATTVMDMAALPGSSTDESWSFVGYSWVCTDTGAGTGKFEFDYGYYDAAGAFQSTSLLSGAAVTIANSSAGANSAYQGTSTSTYANGELIAFSNTTQVVRLICNTQDATCINAAGDFLTISVRLMRKVQES